MREQVAQLLVFYEMGDYRLATSPSGFSIGKFKISVKTCNMFDCYLTLLDFFLKKQREKQLDPVTLCYKRDFKFTQTVSVSY